MAFTNQDAVSTNVSSIMASLAMQRQSPTLSPTTQERGSATIKLAKKTPDKHASLLLMNKRHLAEEIWNCPDEHDCQQPSKRLKLTTLTRQAAVGWNFEQGTNDWQLSKQKGACSEIVAAIPASSDHSSYAKLLGKRRSRISLLDAHGQMSLLDAHEQMSSLDVHEQANDDTLARGISLLVYAFRVSSL